MATAPTTLTDDELLAIKHEGKVEFVNGEVRLMTPAGGEQGEVGANIIHAAERVREKMPGEGLRRSGWLPA